MVASYWLASDGPVDPTNSVKALRKLTALIPTSGLTPFFLYLPLEPWNNGNALFEASTMLLSKQQRQINCAQQHYVIPCHLATVINQSYHCYYINSHQPMPSKNNRVQRLGLDAGEIHSLLNIFINFTNHRSAQIRDAQTTLHVTSVAKDRRPRPIYTRRADDGD